MTFFQRARYYPYGIVRSGSAATDKPYTGQQRETADGVYYYGARFYNADIGRFLQADSIVPEAGNPQDLNRYSYVRNNPVNHNDPTGHCMPDINCPGDDNRCEGGGPGICNLPPPVHTVPLPPSPISLPPCQCPLPFAIEELCPEDLPRPIGGGGRVRLAKLGVRVGVRGGKLILIGAGATAAWTADRLKDIDLPDTLFSGGNEQPDDALETDETEEPIITFGQGDGHGARHLEGTGLSQGEVEGAIEAALKAEAEERSFGGGFWGRVDVNGREIEYRGHVLPNGTINVGTYYPPASE